MIYTDISEIAHRYLRQVKKTGPENIMAACPFHTDGNQKTPSFTMSLTKGLYLCFSCQEKGNLRTFLRHVGVSRIMIEKHYQPLLDQVASYQPKRPDPLRPAIFATDPLPESFLGLFDFCPTSLLQEGFNEDLLLKYDVGFDKDNMRVTYPLRDLNGKLMGISGRSVDGVTPKYKIYDYEYTKWGMPPRHMERGMVLWNADRVYPSAFFQKDSKVILVEGFKACLWLIQNGFTNTMALLGTYLSPQHQWILERIGGEVYVMLDNDEWGLRGTARVASRLAASLTVKVVEYPEEFSQPSDLSPEAIQEALASASDYYRWATEEKNRWLLERIRPTSAK